MCRNRSGPHSSLACGTPVTCAATAPAEGEGLPDHQVGPPGAAERDEVVDRLLVVDPCVERRSHQLVAGAEELRVHRFVQAAHEVPALVVGVDPRAAAAMTRASSGSRPTGTAVSPAAVMLSVSGGWAATRTSCPAVRSAHASGTQPLKWASRAGAAISTRMGASPTEVDVAGAGCLQALEDSWNLAEPSGQGRAGQGGPATARRIELRPDRRGPAPFRRSMYMEWLWLDRMPFFWSRNYREMGFDFSSNIVSCDTWKKGRGNVATVS